VKKKLDDYFLYLYLQENGFQAMTLGNEMKELTCAEQVRNITKAAKQFTVDGNPTALVGPPPIMPMLYGAVLENEGWVKFSTVYDNEFFGIWVHPTMWVYNGVSAIGMFMVSADTAEQFQIELDELAETYGENPEPEQREETFFCDHCDEPHTITVGGPRPRAMSAKDLN
jgi:hypothetical protein